MTTSRWYPYSHPYAGDIEHFELTFNYIRNSIKVVVDAYNGSVDYYLVDPSDPIAAAHARIYPGLFKPFDAMPDALKQHVRYPKSLFDVQMDLYKRYHQTDPRTFYNQEDAWELPPDQWRDDLERMRSNYLTLNLIEPDHFEYSLFAPMTPLGQPNMGALVVAGNDGENYGRIIVYRFPHRALVYGPEQVNAFIKQDPEIAQELSLWSHQGSQASHGRLLVVPIEGVVTYIQGIFLRSASESPLPQLARIIVSQGPLVVMASSIVAGFEALHRLIEEKGDQDPPNRLEPSDEPPEVSQALGAAAATLCCRQRSASA